MPSLLKMVPKKDDLGTFDMTFVTVEDKTTLFFKRFSYHLVIEDNAKYLAKLLF